MEIDYNIYPIKPIPNTYNKRSFSYPSHHGKCFWCGKELKKGSRRKAYCSNEHRDEYYTAFTWNRLRSKILRRDNWTCEHCKISDWDTRIHLQVDHKIAITNGGDYWDESNLQTLCRKCHGIKTGRDLKTKNFKKKISAKNSSNQDLRRILSK